MELYQLKSFLTIAHEKNLTRAAETLHLSQSALSSQIKLLEEELGVPLFSRTSRGMVITDQGRILMTHAQDVLEAAGQLQQRAEAMSRGITATISIGLNTDPGFLRISATNQRLNLLHKDTNVIFHLCQSAATISTYPAPTPGPQICYARLKQPIWTCMATCGVPLTGLPPAP